MQRNVPSSSSQMEFSVQMKCESCAAKVRSKLENVAGKAQAIKKVKACLLGLFVCSRYKQCDDQCP